MPPAAPPPTSEVFESTESEPTETPENSEIQSQPNPPFSDKAPRAEHGYSIVVPARRAPQRAEPPLKVRTAAG